MHLEVLEIIKKEGRIIPAGFVLTWDNWNTHRDCRRGNDGNITQTRILNAYLLAGENLEDEETFNVEFHYELDLNTDSPKTESEFYEFIKSKETVEIVE